MRRFITTSLLLAMIFGFAAFQCSSTEITSAKLYKEQDQIEKAKMALKREVAKNPQSVEGYYLLGEIYAEELNADSMLYYFDKSLEVDTTYVRQIEIYKYNTWIKECNNGSVYWKKSQDTTEDSSKIYVDKAIEAYESAIKCQPDSAYAYSYLAYVTQVLGRHEDAVAPLEKLLEIDGSAAAYQDIAVNYFNMSYVESYDSLTKAGFIDKGIEMLEAGSAKYPDDPDLLKDLTEAYQFTGRIEEARKKLEVGIRTQPDNKYFRFSYGLIMIDANETEEALKHLDKALEIDPEFDKALYYKGTALFNAAVNIKLAAEEKYTKSSEQKMFDAEVEKSKEKFKDALDLFISYTKMDIEKPLNAWDPIWKIYIQLGMNEEAEEARAKANAMEN